MIKACLLEQKTIAHVLHEPVTTPPILANGTWMPRARLRPSAPTVKYSTLSSRSTAEALTIGWGTRTITNPGTVTCMGTNSDCTPLPGFETDALTDKLIRYLEQPKDQPFFAVLRVFPPHNPYLAPEQFAEGLCAENIKLPSNVPNVPWVKQQAQRSWPGITPWCATWTGMWAAWCRRWIN